MNLIILALVMNTHLQKFLLQKIYRKYIFNLFFFFFLYFKLNHQANKKLNYCNSMIIYATTYIVTFEIILSSVCLIWTIYHRKSVKKSYYEKMI